MKNGMGSTAFAFRGYNTLNLGRTPELLEHAAYGPVLERILREFSEANSVWVGRDLKLVERVRERRETTLADYADAIVLIVGAALGQLKLLEQFFGVKYQSARMAMGYSLGEVAALIASGTLDREEALRTPLALSEDCIALADDVTLGVLFARGHQLPLDEVHRQYLHINAEGNGVMGISAYLAPNSVLLMGQRDTLDRFNRRINEKVTERLYLRKNEGSWPPMHTPITWERNIPNRCAKMLHTARGGFAAPSPPVFSLVTGDFSYNDYNAREILHRWTDQPQRLWDAVAETLEKGIETVVHVGPSPNIIPATYHRLSDNVTGQLQKSIGMRAVSNIVRRPWLKSLLPARTALLRAPMMKQIILEDWLLEQTP
ncbi:ACP S-malonyltransferase [Lignipirellula cremea]|nr:ACP S-malonyltransferase [Lignipirellula cremea]